MKRLLTLFAITAALPGLALAATDGTLGDSSSGTADITFNVTEASGAQIQVTGLEDINLTAERNIPLNTTALRLEPCVYMDQPGQYSAALEATPLKTTSGLVLSEYRVGYAELSSSKTVEETVTDETKTLLLADLPASGDIACQTGGASPLIAVAINGPTTLTQSGIATATITLTVSPD